MNINALRPRPTLEGQTRRAWIDQVHTTLRPECAGSHFYVTGRTDELDKVASRTNSNRTNSKHHSPDELQTPPDEFSGMELSFMSVKR
jgi:hypothetical protein